MEIVKYKKIDKNFYAKIGEYSARGKTKKEALESLCYLINSNIKWLMQQY